MAELHSQKNIKPKNKNLIHHLKTVHSARQAPWVFSPYHEFCSQEEFKTHSSSFKSILNNVPLRLKLMPDKWQRPMLFSSVPQEGQGAGEQGQDVIPTSRFTWNEIRRETVSLIQALLWFKITLRFSYKHCSVNNPASCMTETAYHITLGLAK